DFCIDAVDEALRLYGRPEIFNTDQGSQFTSDSFTEVLIDNGIAISMDGKGSWRDNVFVERFWRTVNERDRGLVPRGRQGRFARPGGCQRSKAGRLSRPQSVSGGSEIDELGDVGDVLEPIEALDQPLGLVRLQGTRRRLAITPKLGEVVVPTEGLGRIAVDD